MYYQGRTRGGFTDASLEDIIAEQVAAFGSFFDHTAEIIGPDRK
jgi:hypothetical protein